MLKKLNFLLNICSSVFNCHDHKNNFNYNYAQKENIQKSANLDLDPCMNFYEYACGNYYLNNTNQYYTEITGRLDYQINMKMLQLVQTRRYNRNVETYFDKMETYFKACKFESRRNIRRYLFEVKPGLNKDWPLLKKIDRVYNTWLEPEKGFDLWGLAGQLQSYGLNNLLIRQQITRHKNDTLSIVLSPVYLQKNGSLPEILIQQVLLHSLGMEYPDKYLDQLNTTDYKWLEMVKQYATTGEVKTVSFNDLAIEYSNLNLQLFLEQLLGREVAKISTITIEFNEYFAYLNLRIWKPNDLENLCNYLMIKFLYYLAVDSTAEFTPLECIKDLRNKFDLAANFEYDNHYFEGNRTRHTVLKMVEKIRLAMAQHFDSNILNLSPQQIQFLKSKLQAIKVNIGNVPENLTLQQLNEYYDEVPLLDTRNYYKNHLLLLKHRFRKSLLYSQNLSHYIVNDNRVGSSSGPYYVLQQNLIIIPFASLQYPMFHNDYVPLYKMSLLGFVLAHELTHAFDVEGLDFDSNGFPLNISYHILAHENFTKSVQCMQDQLPTASISERITDLVAVRLAYFSFVENFDDGSEDWKRAFFFNLAQFFCGTNKAEFIDHDEDSIRLQEIVMNFEPFAKAFQCPRGSPMNPAVKCRLY